MFQPWRLKLREAEEALRGGRLDEAERLLGSPGLQEFLPAKRLMAQVAQQMQERAGRQLRAGATSAGWQDLETAQRLGAGGAEVLDLRQQFIERGLAEATCYIQAGDPAAAVTRLAALEQRGIGGREVRQMKDAADKAVAAQRLCHRGRFVQAAAQLQAALILAPKWTALAEIHQACVERGEIVQRLTEQMHAALIDENWPIVRTLAEAILEYCPDHEPALDARRRAWGAAGMHLPKTAPGNPSSAGQGANDMHARPSESPRPPDQPPGRRFLLWIDGVGGYLVCQGDRISIGQPVQGSYVDVPVLADISRLHATVWRDGESYLIEPHRATQINGRPIDQVTALTDGCEIELAHGVRMRFTIPNPLSRTARLDFISRHRTAPTTDGVLLMAESCVLGNSRAAHVVCPTWTSEVVLFSQGEQLHCRAPEKTTVDGAPFAGRGAITSSSQIVGEDFSLSLEPL